MAETKQFFSNATQRLFSNWTALRMAVEHGHGSQDNASELITYITNFIYDNEDLSTDEVADELADYMSDEFNLSLEDDSEKQIASKLLELYQCCCQNIELAQSTVDKLPDLKPWILSREEVLIQRNLSHNSSTVEQKMETDEASVAAGSDDEWTTVSRRKNVNLSNAIILNTWDL
ncbi:uncharacterized protein LOC123269080 isoform X2 [Cotesia glomerata]|uniref:uncharacterized protein LOC123269080 isoform X2 n=1 Tax=Cotesia glomerata TaxID=32391 RepID=UPI001D0039CC|nr:uncharacterized protein LOC123269080 isoform X2 [Cotesia glomerata]